MSKSLKKISLLIICVLLLNSCALKDRANKNYRDNYQASFFAFDTECNITVFDAKNNTKKYVDKLIDEMLRYDKMFSKISTASEIYKINHRASNEVETDFEVANLFILAKELYLWSDKTFDVSAGYLYNLWDVKHRKTLPSEDDIAKSFMYKSIYDYEVILSDDVDERKAKIIFNDKENALYDFGALVKGYVSDRIKTIIYEDGIIDSAIINLGGNVCCIGEKKDRDDKSFYVGIFKPFSEGEIAKKVMVKGKCVITSGNYQRYFKVPGDDRIYHHIINPKTGYPTNNGIDSVTIISENGLLGDYLSTASMLLGYEKSKELIDKCKVAFEDNDIEAIYIYSNGKIEEY